MPISVTSTSVSGSSLHTVKGSPISLFWLPLAHTVAAAAEQRAPRMSLVDVLPVDPTTATTLAPLFARTSPASAGERGELVVGNKRCRTTCACVVDELDAGVERDEQVARASERVSRP